MIDATRDQFGDRSMFEIGAVLLKNRWRIARWTILGAIVAVGMALTRPGLYRGSASFAPQGNDASRASLAGLAGQFGVSLSSVGQGPSPEYYARLLKSRELLRPIVSDTFTVSEDGNRRVSFAELFKISQLGPAQREDRGVELLGQMVGTSVSKTTGIVDLTVDTRWRSVSLAITDTLIAEVNNFNQRRQQTQAAAERRFVEGRLTLASTELRNAEDRLGEFLQRNKQFSNSPELALQRDRLQADAAQRRQLYTTLAQSYEEARIKEVRDTPVITVIERPFVPATTEPRGRIKLVILGVMVGAFIGIALVLITDMMRRRRAAGDANAAEFVHELASLGGDVKHPLRWIGRRSGS